MSVTYKNIQAGNDQALLTAVSTSPVAATINVGGNNFFYYSGGIMDALDPSVCGTTVNHAVEITGYDYDSVSGKHYYIFKNSWGTGWGENGFGRISRDSVNPCGLSSSALTITLA